MNFDSLSHLNARAIRAVISSYQDPVVKAYSRGRFWILRQRFLEEIGQYLPRQGRVIDIGCGFGLFSLYFALNLPDVEFHGFDLNAGRIDMARAAATKLGLTNVHYEVGDARAHSFSAQYDACYLLDIIHHIPEESVRPLVNSAVDALSDQGVLLVKDVDTQPAYKRWFTWWLDKMMDPRAPVRYWSHPELFCLLSECGFLVRKHSMVDFLPYPHVLYVCHKKQAGADSQS